MPLGKTTWNSDSKLVIAHADPRFRADVTRRLRRRGPAGRRALPRVVRSRVGIQGF